MENKNLGVIIAIVLGLLIVGAAVVWGSGGAGRDLFGSINEPSSEQESFPIRPVTNQDHILGNPEAPIVLVEYSDLECPFCKNFHATTKQAVAAYPNGELAIVYRHFPLDGLHAKARVEAEAAECAAKLGGNEGFWAYIDKIFAVTPSNDGLDTSLLPVLAAEVGLDRAAFEACQASGEMAAIVEADYQDATAAGGTGTPFVIVWNRATGEQVQLPGAVPLSQIKATVDSMLAATDFAPSPVDEQATTTATTTAN